MNFISKYYYSNSNVLCFETIFTKITYIKSLWVKDTANGVLQHYILQ